MAFYKKLLLAQARVQFIALRSSRVDRGGCWGSLGLLLKAFGFLGAILTAQGLDAKAILVVPGGHGAGWCGGSKTILPPPARLVSFAPTPRGQSLQGQRPTGGARDLED